MWTALDLDGTVIYRHPDWDDVVRWAMKQGGELDIVFQAWVTGE